MMEEDGEAQGHHLEDTFEILRTGKTSDVPWEQGFSADEINNWRLDASEDKVSCLVEGTEEVIGEGTSIEGLQLNCGENEYKQQEQGDGTDLQNNLVARLQSLLHAKDAETQHLNKVVMQLEQRLFGMMQGKGIDEIGTHDYMHAHLQTQALLDQATAVTQQEQELKYATCRYQHSNLQMEKKVQDLQVEKLREHDRQQKLATESDKFGTKETHLENAPDILGCKQNIELVSQGEAYVLNNSEVECYACGQQTLFNKCFDRRAKIMLQNNLQSSFTSTGKNRISFENWLGKKKLEQKIEVISARLHKCRSDLRTSECDRKASEQTVIRLIDEIQKWKSGMSLANENGQTAPECPKSTDFASAKEIFKRLELLEMENVQLRHMVAVDKEAKISPLERELKKVKAQASLQKQDFFGVESVTKPRSSREVTELEKELSEKTSLILELKFESQEEKSKILQLQENLKVLSKKIHDYAQKNPMNCDLNLVDAILHCGLACDHSLSTEIPLGYKNEIEKQTISGICKQEQELHLLVYALKRVIERMRKENAKLKQASQYNCHCKHLLQKNRVLKEKLDVLKTQNVQSVKEGLHDNLPQLERVIEGLKVDLNMSTDINFELMCMLEEAKKTSPELAQKLNWFEGESGTSILVSDQTFSLKSSKSISMNNTKNTVLLENQRQLIAKLQAELESKNHILAHMASAINEKDEELDFLHGLLTVKEACKSSELLKEIKSLTHSQGVDTTY